LSLFPVYCSLNIEFILKELGMTKPNGKYSPRKYPGKLFTKHLYVFCIRLQHGIFMYRFTHRPVTTETAVPAFILKDKAENMIRSGRGEYRSEVLGKLGPSRQETTIIDSLTLFVSAS